MKQLQGQLADYNLVNFLGFRNLIFFANLKIIDRQNTNSNLRSLENEVEQAILANQGKSWIFPVIMKILEMTADVEEMFNERRLREERVQELEQRVERLRTQNNERMNIVVIELDHL